jgi:hypothetical protein
MPAALAELDWSLLGLEWSLMKPMPAALAEFNWRSLGLEWSLRSVYIVCAVVGGAVLLIQTGLLFLGFHGGDAEFDYDTDVDVGDGSFSVLSTRAIAAFLTFFGLAGWGAFEAGWGRGASVGVGVLSGAAVMVLVAWVLHLQLRLASRGNVEPKNAIGETATVYLRIPAKRAGQGKITVSIQGRTHEFLAVTAGPAIPTGDAVRILSMPTAGTFEVVPLNEE